MVDKVQLEYMVNSKPRDINLAICAEECSELIKEITKVMRYPDYPKERLVEEMADVIIILEMLKHSEKVSDEDLQKMVTVKMRRNMKRITPPVERIQACGDGILLFKICVSLLKEKYKYNISRYHHIMKEVTDIILERGKSSLEEANITLLSKLGMQVQYATYLISYEVYYKLLEIPNYDFKAFINDIGEKPIDSLSEKTEVFKAITQSIPNITDTRKLVRKEAIANLFPQIFYGYTDDLKQIRMVKKSNIVKYQLSKFELCFKRIATYYKSLATDGVVLLDLDDLEIDRAKLGIAIHCLINDKIDVVGHSALNNIIHKYYELIDQYPNIKTLPNDPDDAMFVYNLIEE